MEKSLFRWVLKHSARSQFYLVLITITSFPIVYISLELPKIIVNDALQGVDFPREILNFEFDQIPYLFLLCGTFFAMVILNNVVKYFFNTYRGVVGERMLRRLRYDLYERVMRMRPSEYRKASPGEIVQMVTAEVEPLSGFVSAAVAVPAFQGGMLAVYIVFIFIQDPLLGAAAIFFYPIQAWIIPKLQRRVVALQHDRIANVRAMSDDIGEAVAGLRDVHANAAAPWRLATLTAALHRNFVIRYAIYRRKFLIKFVNNFVNQLTPFLFYSIGGYLVIVGRLDLGALVAVLAAYKDLAGPWKELLNYYQLQADMRVRYATIVERFEAAETEPRRRLFPDKEEKPLSGELKFNSVSAAALGGSGELKNVSVKVESGARVAVFGSDECGRDTFLQLATRQLEPQSGSVTVGGVDLNDASYAAVSAAMAFVDDAPAIFSGTLRDNFRYSILRPPEMDEGAVDNDLKGRIVEARRTANLEVDSALDWTSYDLTGYGDSDELDMRLIELCDAFGLDGELRGLGLDARIDPELRPDLADAITRARSTLAERAGAKEGIADVVEFWERDRFNDNASVAENVLFSMPKDAPPRLKQLYDDPEVYATFAGTEAEAALAEMGLEVVAALAELLRNVSADSRLMKDLNLFRLEDLPEYERLAQRAEAKGVKSLSRKQKARLAGVAFELIPAKHRLGVISDKWRAAILSARELFEPVRDRPNRFIAFDSDNFIPGLSLRDNLLIGKPRLNRREKWGKIDEFLRMALRELNLETEVKLAAFDTPMAFGGPGMSFSMKLRLALIRAILRRPQFLVLDGVAATASKDDRKLFDLILSQLGDIGLLYGVASEASARRLDRAIVIQDGRLTSFGSVDEALGEAAE